MSRQRHCTRPCPACGHTLVRVRRTAAEREMVDPATGLQVGRYRCAHLSCGWQGLLPRETRPSDPAPAPAPAQRTPAAVTQPVPLRRPPRRLPWAQIGSVGLVGALMLLVGVQAGRHMVAAPTSLTPPPQSLAQGEHHEGDLLPANHPWLRPVALSAQQAVLPASAAASAGAAAASAAEAPKAIESLAMRKGCVWGKPGSNPYRGTVEEALLHARLPPEVVREVSRKVKAREVDDRVEIRTGSIRGVKNGQEFDPQRFVLTYGRTVCLGSRVNFPQGHVEGADLYQVADAQGRRFAVMVPDVCGNVSVLGERGERRRTLAAQNVNFDGQGDDVSWENVAFGDGGSSNSVPEPTSLAAVLAALAALALVHRRRQASRVAALERRPAAD